MLDIYIINDVFMIKNIDKKSIKNIYSIYENTCDFRYATGIFYLIDYNQFSQQISQFISRQNVFFLDICLVPSGELIGFVKGLVIDKDKIVWINSLVINKPYQSNGYGKRVMELLEYYLKQNYEVEKIYLSVYKTNIAGINFWKKCGYGKCDSLYQKCSAKSNELVRFMWKII
ncbi:MAG: GNAT family N-acetyltransferase [Ruminiclostridium sp.]